MALSFPPPSSSESLYYDFRDQRHREASSHQPTQTAAQSVEWTPYSIAARFTESTESPTGSFASSPASYTHPPSTSSESPSELSIEDLLDVSALEDDSIFTSSHDTCSTHDLAHPHPCKATLSPDLSIKPTQANDPSSPPEPSSEYSSRLSRKSAVATEGSYVGCRALLLEGAQSQYGLVSTRACPLLTCRKNFKSPLALRLHIKRHYRVNQKQGIWNALVPTHKINWKLQHSYRLDRNDPPFSLLKEEDHQASPSVAGTVDRLWAHKKWEEEAKRLQFDGSTQQSLSIYSRSGMDASDSPSRPLPTESRLKIFRPHLSSGSPFDITLTEIIATPSSYILSAPSSDHSSTSPPFSPSSTSNASVFLLNTPLNILSPLWSPVSSKPLTIDPTEVVSIPDFICSHSTDALPSQLEVELSPVDHDDLADLVHCSKSLLVVGMENDTEEDQTKRARTVSSSRTNPGTRSTKQQRTLKQGRVKRSQMGPDTESMDQGIITQTSNEVIAPLRRENQAASRSIPFCSIPEPGTWVQPRPVRRGRPPKSKVATSSPVPAVPVSYNDPLDLPSRYPSSTSGVKIGSECLNSQQETPLPSSKPVSEHNLPMIKEYPQRKRKTFIYSDSEVDDHEPVDDTYVEEGENPRPRKRPIGREGEYRGRPRKGKGKKYPCTMQGCTSTFVRKSDIDRHIERIHRRVSYLCPSCNLAFSRTDAVLRHMRLLHGIELSPGERDFETIQT